MKTLLIAVAMLITSALHAQKDTSLFILGDFDSAFVNSIYMSDMRLSVQDSLGEALYITKDSGLVIIDSLRSIKILLKILYDTERMNALPYIEKILDAIDRKARYQL